MGNHKETWDNIVKRIMLRFRFLVLHPIRSVRHLISGNRDYSKVLISEISVYLKSPKVIVEAGAADGVDTLSFSENFPSATIYAIEPVVEQYEFLLSKTKNKRNIDLTNIALSEANEELQIHVGSGTGHLGGMGSSSLLKPLKHEEYFPEISFNRQQAIKAMTLDSFIQSKAIDLVDLLWLDIQGKEFDVLYASRETFIRKVKLVHLEISRITFYSDQPSEKKLRKFLKDSGFICVIDRVGAISGNAVYLNPSIN
jgi:FkbM family methyltransferase